MRSSDFGSEMTAWSSVVLLKKRGYLGCGSWDWFLVDLGVWLASFLSEKTEFVGCVSLSEKRENSEGVVTGSSGLLVVFLVSSFGACFRKCGEWRWGFGVWKKWRNREAMVV